MEKEAIERFATQLRQFQSALARLEEMLHRDEDEAVRDSIVLRYLLTFEAAWKAMYQFLVGHGENVPKSAWAVLPQAFTALLIADAGEWSRARKYRNVIGHDYNAPTAIEIAAYARAPGLRIFRDLEKTLLQQLEKLNA